MDEQTKILGRIREALQISASKPGAPHGQANVAQAPTHSHAPRDPSLQVGEWLPAVGDSFEERVAAFAKQAQDLRTEFCLLDGPAALGPKLRQIAAAEGWTRMASHEGALTTPITKEVPLAQPLLVTDAGYSALEMEQCQAGITECDALVAQTGSVMITARSAGGRALSVLPPHHVVLARREQLLRDLPGAFAYLHRTYHGRYPSFMSVITGPSRTGDIERILVLGAHGPKKLTVLCC